jgi:hypothetical protein
MKKLVLLPIFIATLFVSCSSDDDNQVIIEPIEPVVAPADYTFTRNNESTVSFGGQTTRIFMAEEIISDLKNNSKSEASLLAMFNHQEGADDFSDPLLNASGKSVKQNGYIERLLLFKRNRGCRNKNNV